MPDANGLFKNKVNPAAPEALVVRLIVKRDLATANGSLLLTVGYLTLEVSGAMTFATYLVSTACDE